MSRKMCGFKREMALPLFVAAGALILAVAMVIPAESQSRFSLGPVFRSEHLSVGGRAGWVPVAGIEGSFQFTERFGLIADLTQASGHFGGSYEGWFVSFAEGPDATREEIEALAPIARRTLTYFPGAGGSVAFTVRRKVSPRASIVFRTGFSGRNYRDLSTFEILEIPEGVDPDLIARSRAFDDTSRTTSRGGFLAGLDVPIDLSPQFSLTPEIRFGYWDPPYVGNRYVEFGLGIRAMWSF